MRRPATWHLVHRRGEMASSSPLRRDGMILRSAVYMLCMKGRRSELR